MLICLRNKRSVAVGPMLRMARPIVSVEFGQRGIRMNAENVDVREASDVLVLDEPMGRQYLY